MSTSVKLSSHDRCAISNLSSNICETNKHFKELRSKLAIIKATDGYSVRFYYYNNLENVPGTNITSIVYTGTINGVVETVTETLVYDDPSVPGSNLISKTLS